MKADERALLIDVANLALGDTSVRDIIEGTPSLNGKRAAGILQKWTVKRWYEYGVSLDLGWLTEAGKAEAERQLQSTLN